MRNDASIGLLVLLGIGLFALSRNSDAYALPFDPGTGNDWYTPPYVPDGYDYYNGYTDTTGQDTSYTPIPQTPQETNMAKNLDAFLRAIRVGEGASDDQGYYRLVGGGNFTDDSMHPGENIKEFPPGAKNAQGVSIARRTGGFLRMDITPKGTTAAGAYQITLGTWRLLRDKYGLNEFPDFTPFAQDNAAVRLISEKRGAMNDILAGRIDDAVFKVRGIWESLPGSGTRPQNEVTIADFKNYFQQYGGVIA